MMSTDNAAAVSRRTSMPAAVHGRAIGFPAFDPSFKPMIALCAVVLVVTACKTTGSTPGPDSYNMFFSPADHLTELTAAGKIDEAGKVYEAQREYFTPDSKKRAAVVGEYWNALRARLDPRIDAASRRLGTLSWPVSVDRWAEARETLSATRQVIEAIEANLIVAEKRFPFHALKDLKTALSATETTIHDDASTQLAKYDLTGSADFFATYPAAVNARSVFSTAAEALVDRFADATREDLVRIHETYRQALTESLNRALGKRYFDLARENRGGTGGRDLKTIVSAALETRAAGLPLDRIDGVKLGMIEITSETLLREGQIDYPISIEIDLPFDAEKAELDAAFTGDQAQAADHLFIVDVALAKASRRVLGIDKTPSTILSHYREDPNPRYNLVQNEVNNARMTAQQSAFATTAAANQFCQGMACIGRLVAVYAAKARQDEAEAALQAAMTKLGQTSQTVKTPVFRDYAFDVANIKTNKTTTVNYYIIDRVRKKYFKSTFDIVEDKSFRVAYNVDDRDPKRTEYVEGNDSETDVDEWERAPATVPLTRLARHYFDNADGEKPLPRLAAIRREMLADKNVALARYRADQFKTRPVEDPRLKHVVVVYTSKSLGSGFFVKADIVLTNWHVVDNQKFIEMKMHGGQETFGKVIAKDVRLDLALVRVQQRGAPVALYGEKKLELGRTVEAIGHPKGLEFSVTRGVISAVREHPSINLPPGAGKAVLYLQTDAPINRGNSGGPLFLGDKVVGVNTWKQPDIQVRGGQAVNVGEGLNFSVHYFEVEKFLKDYLTSYGTGAS